jgi:hypothetical protein
VLYVVVIGKVLVSCRVWELVVLVECPEGLDPLAKPSSSRPQLFVSCATLMFCNTTPP